jgi:hypothetical protein
MSECLYRSDRAEAWHGNALLVSDVDAVLGKRKADALIFDGPFSARTHEGHKNGKMTADRAAAFGKETTGRSRTRERAYAARKGASGESGRRDIEYEHWTPAHVRLFCDIWIPRTNGWVVSITDDVLAPAWRTSYLRHGLYPFAPLPLVETGSRCRMTGDGPSAWSCWLVVARPAKRAWARWRTLPGYYVQAGERDINSKLGSDRIVGAKPVESMIAIVEDYSADGATVVDPTFGGCTTGLSALRCGRRFIGMELDAERAKLGAERLEAEENLSDRRSVLAGQMGLFASNATVREVGT